MMAAGMSAPAPAGKLSRNEWALLALVLLALALWRLGGAPLFDVDEGAFSEATREMLSSGDWLHTTLNGEPRFDKPIGVYWLQALSASAFGVGEFAMRLPSALSGWLWALVLAQFALPRLGRQVAVSATVMLATSLGVLIIGRAATADALLNLLLTLTALDGWRWLSSDSKPALRRAYAWMGLGLLTKGPVAIIVPGAALLLWLFCSLPWRAALARLGRAMADPVAWLLMLGIAVPWYAYALHRHGQAFIDGFLIRHNLARYTSPLEQHGGSIGYYLVVVPLLLLPWAPLLAGVLARVKRHWADPLQRYLLLWAGFVIVFFSLSGTKLPHYALYGATPLVLLMAITLAEAGTTMRAALTVSLLLLLALLCGSALAMGWWLPQVTHPLYKAVLEGQHASPWLAWLSGLAALAVLFLMTQLNRPGWTLALRSGVSALVIAVVALGVALPWWGDLLQGPIKRAAAIAAERNEPAVQWGLHQPSFALYRGQSTPRRAPHDGELALVRLDQLPKLIAQAGGRYIPLYAERGYALILWRAAAPAATSVAQAAP
ncbi:ArnT family glycosyltransferase [Ideonella azotifigens]|nr:glycosyltransferase family 39 protein [Ideonella azotifigens]